MQRRHHSILCIFATLYPFLIEKQKEGSVFTDAVLEDIPFVSECHELSVPCNHNTNCVTTLRHANIHGHKCLHRRCLGGCSCAEDTYLYAYIFIYTCACIHICIYMYIHVYIYPLRYMMEAVSVKTLSDDFFDQKGIFSKTQHPLPVSVDLLGTLYFPRSWLPFHYFECPIPMSWMSHIKTQDPWLVLGCPELPARLCLDTA